MFQDLESGNRVLDIAHAESIDFSWENLTVSVPQKRKYHFKADSEKYNNKVILDNGKIK